MADPEDIDKLLAEIDAMNKRPLTPASPAPAQPPATAAAQGTGRGQWTAIAAGGAGVVGLVGGSILSFLPYISGLSTGIGAALGGAAVAFLSGPPPWFHRR